jgi:hypothetical protein
MSKPFFTNNLNCIESRIEWENPSGNTIFPQTILEHHCTVGKIGEQGVIKSMTKPQTFGLKSFLKDSKDSNFKIESRAIPLMTHDRRPQNEDGYADHGFAGVGAGLQTVDVDMDEHPIESRESCKPPLYYSKFLFSKVESGQGITLGNSLRRILLYSMPNFSIISIKIIPWYIGPSNIQRPRLRRRNDGHETQRQDEKNTIPDEVTLTPFFKKPSNSNLGEATLSANMPKEIQSIWQSQPNRECLKDSRRTQEGKFQKVTLKSFLRFSKTNGYLIQSPTPNSHFSILARSTRATSFDKTPKQSKGQTCTAEDQATSKHSAKFRKPSGNRTPRVEYYHEFSTLPGSKESILELTKNLQSIIFRFPVCGKTRQNTTRNKNQKHDFPGSQPLRTFRRLHRKFSPDHGFARVGAGLQIRHGDLILPGSPANSTAEVRLAHNGFAGRGSAVDMQSHVELGETPYSRIEFPFGETEPATVDMDMQSLEKVYLFLPPYSHLQEWKNQFLQEHAQRTYSSNFIFSNQEKFHNGTKNRERNSSLWLRSCTSMSEGQGKPRQASEHKKQTHKAQTIKENDTRTNNSFFLAKHLCVAASQSRGSTMGEQDNDSSLKVLRTRILQKNNRLRFTNVLLPCMSFISGFSDSKGQISHQSEIQVLPQVHAFTESRAKTKTFSLQRGICLSWLRRGPATTIPHFQNFQPISRNLLRYPNQYLMSWNPKLRKTNGYIVECFLNSSEGQSQFPQKSDIFVHKHQGEQNLPDSFGRSSRTYTDTESSSAEHIQDSFYNGILNNPIKKVNYTIELAGERSEIFGHSFSSFFNESRPNENVFLEIWTNGALSPEQALKYAIQKLIFIYKQFIG